MNLLDIMDGLIGLGLPAELTDTSTSSLLHGSRIANGKGGGTLTRSRANSTMRGLLLAETGGGMVEHDITQGHGFKQGQHILVDTLSPGYPPRSHRDTRQSDEMTQPGLFRHGTLLSSGVSPARNAAELKRVLGNGNNRLKPGASLLPADTYVDETLTEKTSLEHAKARARVEVDIWLDSDICAQGGHLNGRIKIRVRPRGKKEGSVMLAGGKLRAVGF